MTNRNVNHIIITTLIGILTGLVGVEYGRKRNQEDFDKYCNPLLKNVRDDCAWGKNALVDNHEMNIESIRREHDLNVHTQVHKYFRVLDNADACIDRMYVTLNMMEAHNTNLRSITVSIRALKVPNGEKRRRKHKEFVALVESYEQRFKAYEDWSINKISQVKYSFDSLDIDTVVFYPVGT
ncbi:hypothetical protein COB64_04530 [Candidatus Wolfebacteria bacterium]|nr:MAG: hypothetical protein COB64_04530 [Candidatus Wolfebacteria bacterium]